MKSALRVLLIVELLTEEPRPLTFADIMARLGIPKSSAHALLRTMVERGHLRLDPSTRTYSLGIRIWQAGQGYLRDFELPVVARPFLQAARDELGETVQLAVLDGVENVYIGKEDSDHNLALNSHVGGRLPAHTTALGKVLLAGLPDHELARRFQGIRMPAFTPNTITDLATLKSELAKVQRDGYATDHEEFTLGVVCVAVPVIDYSTEVVTAISTSVPQVRATPPLQRKAIKVLTEQASALSRLLGAGSGAPHQASV